LLKIFISEHLAPIPECTARRPQLVKGEQSECAALKTLDRLRLCANHNYSRAEYYLVGKRFKTVF